MKNKMFWFCLPVALGACGTNGSYDLRFEASADGRYQLVGDNPCGEAQFSWQADGFSIDLQASASGELSLDVFTSPGTYEGEFFCDLESQGDLTITVQRDASGDLELNFDSDNFEITTSIQAYEEAIACTVSPCVVSVPQNQPLSLSVTAKGEAQDLDCAIVCGDEAVSSCIGEISLPAGVQDLACAVSARPRANTATLIVDADLTVTSDDVFVASEEGFIFSAIPARAIVHYAGSDEIRWLGHCEAAENNTAVVLMNAPGIFRCDVESTTPASGSVAIEIQVASSGDELDGTIVATGAELNCNGAQCNGSADIGAVVTLRGVSETGADLTDWGECASLGTVDDSVLRFEVTEAIADRGSISCTATFSRDVGCPGGEPPRPVFTIVDEQGVAPAFVDDTYQMPPRRYVVDASATPYVGQQGILRWEVSLDGSGVIEESRKWGWRYDFDMPSLGIFSGHSGTVSIFPIGCDETEGEPVVFNFATRF